MVSNRLLFRHVLVGLRYHRRPLLAFHLYFVILAFSLLTPFTGWLLTVLLNLTGTGLVSNDDLVRFLFTPAGLLWLLVSGTFAIVLVFLQHTGMMLIASRGVDHHYPTAAAALWRVAHRLPRLLKLAGFQVAAHLAVAAPFLAILGLAYQRLLGGYDIYYVINEHPPALWGFTAVAALVGLGLAVANGSLYLRWVLALPALLLEDLAARQALRRGAELSRGARLHIATLLLCAGALVALLPALLSLLFDSLGRGLMAVLPEQYGLLIPVLATLIVGYAVLGVAVGFIGVGVNSLVILKLYQKRRGRPVGLPPDPEPRRTGVLAWGIEIIAVLLALVQIGYAIQVTGRQDDVAISAHRGSSLSAPENTLAAIEQAIEDGADYVELDVRQTTDGHLVLLHDRDLRRVAGDPRPIWEVPFAEVRRLDAGRWFGPAFEGEPIPTLSEAIDTLRGRAGLYLEIKTAPQTPDLTRRVVATLQRENFVDQTLLAALEPAVLYQARQLEPTLRTSLLVHSAIGAVEGQPFEALALREALVTPARAAAVRGHDHALHVWTVNDRRAMSRLIDIGVDNIITDRPALLAGLLEERAALSEPERLLIRMRNWVW